MVSAHALTSPPLPLAMLFAVFVNWFRFIGSLLP
jgi:hypothetical protein